MEFSYNLSSQMGCMAVTQSWKSCSGKIEGKKNIYLTRWCFRIWNLSIWYEFIKFEIFGFGQDFVHSGQLGFVTKY